MAKFKVIKPTNVMPETPGPVYGEGETFEVDERNKENARWIDAQLEEGVIAPEGASARKAKRKTKAEAKVETKEEAPKPEANKEGE